MILVGIVYDLLDKKCVDSIGSMIFSGIHNFGGLLFNEGQEEFIGLHSWIKCKCPTLYSEQIKQYQVKDWHGLSTFCYVTHNENLPTVAYIIYIIL